MSVGDGSGPGDWYSDLVRGRIPGHSLCLQFRGRWAQLMGI